MYFFIFLFALVIATDEGCRVACVRSGYDSGRASAKGCACIDFKEDYDAFVHNRVNIGSFDTIRHDDPPPKVKQSLFGNDYFER